MDSILKNPAPNLCSNVEITEERLKELYAWMEGLATDAIRANTSAHHFGIVIPPDGGSAFRLEQSKRKLVLLDCCALTPRGSRIFLREGITPHLSLTLDEERLQQSEVYRVMVEVENGHRRAFGPESKDLPLRPMYSTPSYALSLQSTEREMHEWSNALSIGMVKFVSGAWQLDADYIPPCLQIGAHPSLRTKYSDYRQTMEEMLIKQSEAIQQTNSFRDKAMFDLREFLLRSGSSLATQAPAFEALGPKAPPFELIRTWKAFAKTAAFIINSLGRYTAFYKLLNENLRSVNGVFFTPERFNKTIQDAAELAYNHQDIAAAIRDTDQFLEVIVPVFKALALGPLDITESDPLWSGTQPLTSGSPEKNDFSTW